MPSTYASLSRCKDVSVIKSRSTFNRRLGNPWLNEIGLEDLSTRDIAAIILEAEKKEIASHVPAR